MSREDITNRKTGGVSRAPDARARREIANLHALLDGVRVVSEYVLHCERCHAELATTDGAALLAHDAMSQGWMVEKGQVVCADCCSYHEGSPRVRHTERFSSPRGSTAAEAASPVGRYTQPRPPRSQARPDTRSLPRLEERDIPPVMEARDGEGYTQEEQYIADMMADIEGVAAAEQAAVKPEDERRVRKQFPGLDGQ